LAEDKVRVVQMETGGAFGGKEDYPSIIAGHAALLAMKSGRPVKIIYDRMEDMTATTKRHPSRTRHRTAVSKNGKSWAEKSTSRLMAARMRLCRRWCCRAAPSMPAVLIIGQTFAFARRRSRQTRHRTGLFEALERLRVCSPWSGTWTALRKSWGSLR
jgi:hypothetical protein